MNTSFSHSYLELGTWNIELSKPALQFLCAPLEGTDSAVIGFENKGFYWLAGISTTLINVVRVAEPDLANRIPLACFNGHRALWEMKFGKEEGLTLTIEKTVSLVEAYWEPDPKEPQIPEEFQLEAHGKGGPRELPPFAWNSPTEKAGAHPLQWWPHDISFAKGETHVSKDVLAGAIKAIPSDRFWLGHAKTSGMDVAILASDSAAEAKEMEWFSLLAIAQPTLELKKAS